MSTFFKAFCSFALLLSVIQLHGQDTTHSQRPRHDVKLLPVLWQQHSAEYAALCYQAFNVAEQKLMSTKIKKKKRYAIITDIDETILDNSNYEATQILMGTPYSRKSWQDWTDRADATPVPGAADFMQLVKKKNVTVFYISNRRVSEIHSTIANLKKYNFPNADSAHMLFMQGNSSKEDRRQQVLKDYNVIMYLGDNLNDFLQVFEGKPSSLRSDETLRLRSEWGSKFIVLPNAVYGEWEDALYDYNRSLTPDQKALELEKRLRRIQHK